MDEPYPIRLKSEENFHSHICSHDECQVPRAMTLSYSFAAMPKYFRIDTVQCILLALSAPPGAPKMLLENSKKFLLDDDTGEYCTTRYATAGRIVCSDAFVAITQISMIIWMYTRQMSRMGINSSVTTSITVQNENGKLEQALWLFRVLLRDM